MLQSDTGCDCYVTGGPKSTIVCQRLFHYNWGGSVVSDVNANIFKMVDMLTQVTIRSLDHIMAQIRREADKTGLPAAQFTPFFLEPQWPRVVRLLEQAAALPGAQLKAAELALYIDRLASATGRFNEWLPVLSL